MGNRQGTRVDHGRDDSFARAFASAPTGVALAELDGGVYAVNPALTTMLATPEGELVGRHLADLCPSDDGAAIRASIDALVAGRDVTAKHQLRVAGPPGAATYVTLAVGLVSEEEGAPPFLVSHVQDVTDQLASARALRESDNRFARAFDSAPIGMALATLDGQLMLVNQALRELTGYEDADLLFQRPAHLAVPEDAERCLEELRSALAGQGDGYRLEERWLNARGHQLWVAVSSALVRDEAGRPLYFIWHVEDVSDRRIALDRLQHLADHDALTGLVNRRRFQGELEQQISRARRYGERATVLVVDLDDFKSVNDTHGHQAGDIVLRAVADVLRERVRDTDVVSRIGGDEFAVLLLHVDETRARRMAAEIESTLRTSRVPIGDEAVSVSATVGTALLDPDAQLDQLLADADAEMFRRKRLRASGDAGRARADGSGARAAADASEAPASGGSAASTDLNA